jgi:hypothetical protein
VPAETQQLSEQALKLQAWENELRERERQLLEYRDNLSRPLGAKLPAREAFAPSEREQSIPYDRRGPVVEARSDTAPQRPHYQDIHIHNHLAPVSPALYPADGMRSSREYSAAVPGSAAQEPNRFPYDRVVDYSSASSGIFPSAQNPPYDYASQRQQASAAPSTGARGANTRYAAEFSVPLPPPEQPRLSFADRHELVARMSYESPTVRDTSAPRPVSATRPAASQQQEVDLSGLSLAVRLISNNLFCVDNFVVLSLLMQRIRELTGHY